MNIQNNSFQVFTATPSGNIIPSNILDLNDCDTPAGSNPVVDTFLSSHIECRAQLTTITTGSGVGDYNFNRGTGFLTPDEASWGIYSASQNIYTNTKFNDFKNRGYMTISSDNSYINFAGPNSTGSGYITLSLLNGVEVPLTIDVIYIKDTNENAYHSPQYVTALGAYQGDSTFQTAPYSCSETGANIICQTSDGNSYTISLQIKGAPAGTLVAGYSSYQQITVTPNYSLNNWTSTCDNVVYGSTFTTASCSGNSGPSGYYKRAWMYNVSGSNCVNDAGTLDCNNMPANAGGASIVYTTANSFKFTPGNPVAYSSGSYYITLQADGNLVAYTGNPGDISNPMWASNSTKPNPNIVEVDWQSDGNLVAYDINKNSIWASGTNGKGTTLEIQGDGNMVVYDSNHNPLWSARDFN